MNTTNIIKFGNWTGAQILTMKRTVAPDANDLEFDNFLQYSLAKKLDPFLGHIILTIYNKDKPAKRKAQIIVTQAGQRVLASRCRDYGPKRKEADIVYDEKLKGSANPLGIFKAAVELWKMDSTKTWQPVAGVAYWEERAAIKEEWAENQNGDWKPTGKKTLEGNWLKMGRTMIVKCAEMDALRSGWPEEFDQVYSEEEFDHVKVLDLTATEVMEAERANNRKKQIGMDKEKYSYSDENGDLRFVEAGKFASLFIDRARQCKTLDEYKRMEKSNEEGWKMFWAEHANDALEMKGELETIKKKLSQPAKKVSA